MKKVISVITLIVMMSVNIMDPFTYAISLGDDFEEIQKFDEIVEDENFDDEEKIDDNGENNEILDIEQEDEDDINVGQDELEEIVENENEGKDLSGEGDENGEKEQEILLENIDEDGKEMVEGDEEASQSTGVLLTGGGNNILLEENEIEENESDDNEGDTPIDVVDEMVENEILGLTGNVDILSGDMSVLSGDIENLTGENVELTGTDLELAKARETLNTEVIQGRESSKNVVVYVEADIDTFPQGTHLNIKPIMVSNQLNEIKEQIKDSENNVDDNSEIVAFDISFVYTLSDGSEKEIQPKNGEGVKVIFDYSDNKNLVKADENDEQEVKVFHLDDKDENGEKVAQGEEVVKDVTNIHESGEVGVVVVDAETFSIYAVVTTTLGEVEITYNLNGGYWTEEGTSSIGDKVISYTNGNPTTFYKTPSKQDSNGNKWMFDGWYTDEGLTIKWDGKPTGDMEVYAKWLSFQDLHTYFLIDDNTTPIHKTLMDRNMGATKVYNNVNDNATLGYHYQYGNNYGFPALNDIGGYSYITTIESSTVADSVWGKGEPSKYYRNYFVKKNNWMNTSSTYNMDNMWGGKGDTCNNEGASTSYTGRQGPCPDGYHVPSIHEWGETYSGWVIAASKTKSNTSNKSEISKDLLLPNNINRRKDGGFTNNGAYVGINYMSSTINSSQQVYGFYIAHEVQLCGVQGENKEAFTTSRPVRCFKNPENDISYLSGIYLNGGTGGVISIVNGEVKALRSPSKAQRDFIGWYTGIDSLGQPIGQLISIGTILEDGTSLYAKYDCAQGYVEVEGECVPGFKVVFDANTNGGTSGDNVIIVTGSSSITLDLGDYTAEKEGYYFVGWNTNSGADVLGMSGEQIFAQNTTLYAIFLNLYTYTFVDEEGNILGTGYYQSGVVSDMNRLIPLEYYTNGKVADTSSYPALLTLGVEEGMGRRWIPSLPKNGIATESLIITGEIDNAFTVTFFDGDGSSYLSYGVVSGSKIDYITGPEGEAGYQFVDWYEDAGLNVRFDFSTKTITGNTTIYPGFTEVLCTFTTENVTAGLKITGFSGTPTEECLTHFVIPSKIGGKIVKQIGYRAFKGKSISGEIILPDTVTYIGEEAFANNEISGKLKLPNNIENIDKSAFYNNKISGQLDLPESLTKVGVGAFATNNISGRLVIPGRINNGVVGSEYRCNPIEEVIFGIGTTEITKEAFADHGSICNDSTKHTIKHVEFSSTLQIIRNQAFNGQIIEGELELPNSLTIVEDGAFGGNKISGILRIPGSVTTVTNAFNCNPIEEVVFGEGITKINGNAFNADCNNKKDGKIEKITLPSTLTSIGDRAFKFQSLTGELIIPNGVTSIGYEAFTANKNKIGGQLIIPDSVISIGYNAFENNQITGLILGSSLQTIGNTAFKGNQLTGELIIPNSVTFIGNYAFDGYNGNNRIGGQLVIPDSVTFIGQYAFRNNQITGVILGNGLGTIEAGIFQNNKVGGQLIIPDSVISIGYNAFENNQITGLILGNNLQSIQQLAFNKNRLTGELIIPNSVQTIGNYAFDGNDGGNKISGQLIIPDSVISVGEYAFRSNQITGVILGNGLDTINLGVFYGNKIEGQLIIPDSVIYIGQSSFQNNQITGLVLGRNVDTIRQDAFNQNKLTGELVIPYSVTFIGKQAFDGANGGNKISGKLIIPDNVTYIGEYAFRSNQITSLKLGNSVETIRWNSFENNQIGGELIIPDSVTYIGECAFRSNQITGLVLGSGLNAIYKETFKNNQIEGEFIIPDDINTIGDEAFSNNKISGTLFIPGRINSGIVNNAFRANYLEKVIFGSGITYIKAYAFDGNGRTDLKRQIKSVEFPSTLTGIADYAFRQQRIECLELPDSLMNIGQYAFYQNKISGTLIIPDSVISIGRQSFDNQMSGSLYTLQSVVLGNNVQEVGYGAFLSNRNLKNVYIPDSVEILSGIVFSHNNNPYYTTGYLTTKKSTLNYTGAYLKPIYQLYSYTFVNENGDILGTGYYPEILTSNTTKLISLDYYNGIGNINDFTGADELITSPEGYKVVWSTPLSENSVVTESLVVTGSVEKVHTVVFKNPFTGDIVEYVENNGSLDAPEEYKVQGHTFTGWFSGDVKVDFPLTIISDLTLTGRYDRNSYTVNFYTGDSVETYYTGGIYEYETVLQKPENPTKEGYSFAGWRAISGDNKRMVDFPFTVTGDIDLYAVYGVPVSIDFDANGGKFSDNSTGKTLRYFKEGGELGIKYSHTSNISDDGTNNGNSYGDNQNRIDIVTIPGAESLKVKIVYQTESTSFDWACVWGGNHPDYTAIANCNEKLGGTTQATKEYIISGDTVTFGFKSDHNKNSYYGYYAVVSDYPNYYRQTEIEDPINTGLKFDGWYLDQSGTLPFISPYGNEGNTVYAKWQSYTGWDGCYKYSTIGSDENGNPMVQIDDYSGSCEKENLVIPSTINVEGESYFVTSLGAGSFSSKALSGSVTLPNSLVSIGNGAFSSNPNITSINIYEGVISIGNGAFQYNSGLKGINLPSTLKTIGAWAFYNGGLESIKIPDSVTSVLNDAFSRNTNLRTVKIGTGLEVLNPGVFSNCTGIESVDLGRVQSIGADNFSNTQITGLVIPDSVISISEYAFTYNSKLKNIKIGTGLKTLSNNVFNNCIGIEYVDLGRVQSINEGNFSNTQITGLVIPDTVTNISSYAFSNNINLRTVKIGTGLKTLYYGVFSNCTGIESVDLGELESIYDGNFRNTQITGLVIPNTVTTISQGAFQNNTKLKTVKIGDGLTILDSAVFSSCTDLETVELGNGIETIGSAFASDISLKNIVWGNNVKNIHGGAFWNTAIEELEIPNSVVHIEGGAFGNNPNLKTVKLGTGLETLNSGVFGNCTGIESVDLGRVQSINAGNFYNTQITGLVIPDTVVHIYGGAFANNTKLESVIFTGESQIQSIGGGAFSYSALTGVSLPNSLTTLGTGVFCTDNGTNTGSVIGFIGDNSSATAEQLEEQENTACFVIKNSTYQVNILLTGENMGDFTQDSELSGSKRYGKRIVIRVTPRLGYRFWKWEIDGNPVMTGDDEYWTGDLELVVTSGMNITGFFTGDINTYIVRHRKQNIDDDDYSVVLLETGYGITDMQTNAEVKDFLGFTGLAFDQTGIKADGNTVVDIYYNRELYTITFFDSGSVVTGITAKYEKEITEPEVSEKAGYHFSGWYYDSGELCEFPIPMPLNGVNLTAQWIVNTGTEYRVEYYLQNEDLINYDFHLTGTQYGTSDTHGVALVKTFTGFEFNAVHTGNITSGTIAGDGSLVLRLFYDRKAYTVSTGSNNETQGSVSVEGESRYGKRLIFRANVIDSSLYKFVKWELNGRFVTTGESDDFWTGDLVIENLTGNVIVTGYFVAYSGCEWSGGVITHGTSVTGYFTPIVPYGQTCVSEIRICNDGTLSGTYQYSSCIPEEPLSCALPWGGTTGHGVVVTGYKALSEICPAQCSTVSQVAICDNGNWDVENFTGIYTQPNCITQPVSTEGYDLDECPEYGICSSITGYTVNDNICITGDTKYKLNDCESGWHTEDNVTCTGNTKYEACTPRQGNEKPEHSSNMPGIVPVHWAEGSGWETPVKCDWSCDTHYHTGDDLNSCDIDTFVVTINADVNSGSVSTGTLEVDYGTVLTTSGNELRIGEEVVSEAIAKERDVQYTYRFVDWTNSCAPVVTTGCEITANFESITREYLITFVDGDGKTIQTGMVMYGDTPAYTGAEIPNKTATAQTGYTFNDSWSPEIHPVDGPETYTAEFNETTRSYDITWNYRDENGVRTGKIINVEYGRNPTEPSLSLVSQTAQTGYTFTGWNPSVSEVTTGRTYTAQYDETIREYLIKFIDGNGVVIQSEMVSYGETPEYIGFTPTKTATAKYSYNFNYTWNPEIVPVTTGAEYIAQFNEVVNKYTIIWNNEDGILLEMDENVPYGTMPEYNGATPIKAGHESGNYVFIGWTPTPVSVVGDAVYRAKYKEKETPEDGRKGNKWSGGGGGIEKSSDSYKNTGDIIIIENLVDGNQDSNIHGSALGENGEEIMVPLITKQNMRKYSELVINSYIWAFENDVTTVGEFDKANPEGYVLRGHLAKMMVNFSANVLGREIPIDIPVSCEWEDDSSEWESPEIKFYAKKACALGIMGIKVKKFEPNKTVSRAEFGTVLSRVLWGDKYDVRNPTRKNRYYARHLQILKEKGIMSQTENPLDRIELRKWIWVMLRRAQELK